MATSCRSPAACSRKCLRVQNACRKCLPRDKLVNDKLAPPQVSGSGPALNIQKDVGSVVMAPFRAKGFLGLGSGRTAFVDEAVSLEECSISVCRTSFVTLSPFFLVFPFLPQITQHLGADDAGCQDSNWTQICFARCLAALLRRETVISLVD
jgi:hypothetical protein